MASFWIEYPGNTGLQPTKLVGNLPVRRAMREFPRFVAQRAIEAGGKIDWRTPQHAIIIPPTGERVLYSLELLSPPSAPEPGQAKRTDGGVALLKGEPMPAGVLVHRNGVDHIGVSAAIEGKS